LLSLATFAENLEIEIFMSLSSSAPSIMAKFQTDIQKFGKKGEKTGWTYIVVGAKFARQLNPGSKVSFRVKGRLDSWSFEGLALLPMGEGDFILPLNAAIRKAIRKKQGDSLIVEMNLDSRAPVLSADLLKCLKQEPASLAFFKSLPRSHQNYFSKWIEGAKTIHTKTKRIVMAVTALALKQGYGEMIRAERGERGGDR
jgi:hypothetical protein